MATLVEWLFFYEVKQRRSQLVPGWVTAVLDFVKDPVSRYNTKLFIIYIIFRVTCIRHRRTKDSVLTKFSSFYSHRIGRRKKNNTSWNYGWSQKFCFKLFRNSGQLLVEITKKKQKKNRPITFLKPQNSSTVKSKLLQMLVLFRPKVFAA